MSSFSSDNIADQPEWGCEAVPQNVLITYLQMTDRVHAQAPVSLTDDVQIVRAELATPELVRWLYGVVGGPYRWYERLGWSRESWQEELEEEGSEIWLLMVGGTPAGYCQLHVGLQSGGNSGTAGSTHSETEILYFGLMDWAQGRGLGRSFLQQMILHAWEIDSRHHLPEVHRVWVHTCNLDGPYALANYKSRGLEVYMEETHQEVVLKEPLGSWNAMFVQ